MEYITPEKMREIDRRTQEEFDIPAAILMENARRAVFQTAMEMLCEKQELLQILSAYITSEHKVSIYTTADNNLVSFEINQHFALVSSEV
ncbi:MAG: hypothetical protein DRI01_06770 [Chloroflexi bacterium]|nr:MAG: hypothetical protein DRI01_06770 [Chloroflexota bacterium]